MSEPPTVSAKSPLVDLDAYAGWLFDLDGVLTKTADVHAAAWAQTFNAFLVEEETRTGVSYAPFDSVLDYQRYVDGQARADGVRNFFRSRGIELEEGAPNDPPGARSVGGIGNAKNVLLLEVLRNQGIAVYDGAVALVRELRRRGKRVAVVSASENARAALEAGGIVDLFDARVDGEVVRSLQLAGKPAPDSFLEGARELGVDPAGSVVVEDALAGVQAGRSGRFGLVVGVDNHDPSGNLYADALIENGADVVYRDLGDLLRAAPPLRARAELLHSAKRR